MKGFTPKDAIPLGVAVLVLVIVMVFVPLAPWMKGLIGFALAAAVYFGVGYILDPRTATDLAEAQDEGEFQETLREILSVSQLCISISRECTRKATSLSLVNTGNIIKRLHGRFEVAGRKETVNAARLARLLKQVSVGIDRYGKIVRGEIFLSSRDKKAEIDDTELQKIPMYEQVVENLGIRLDSGSLDELNVAEDTFEALARTYGLFQTQLDETKEDK